MIWGENPPFKETPIYTNYIPYMDPIRVVQRCSSALMVFLGRRIRQAELATGRRPQDLEVGNFWWDFFLGGLL